MRITQQHVVQQALNASGNTKALKQLVGQVLQGQITNIQSNQLATLIMGGQKLNVDIKDLNLNENQMVQLEVVGVDDGVLVAKLVGDAPRTETADAMGELLKRFGVPDQPENRLILETMKQAGLPINNKTFQLMRQGLVEVKALQMEMKNTTAPLLEQSMDQPIKTLALKIINDASISAGVDPDAKVMQSNQSTLPQSPQVLQAQMPANAEVLVVSNSTFVDGDEPTVKTNSPSGVSVANDSSFLDAIKMAFGGEKNTVEAFETLLSKFDLKQESLLIKNDLPMTLKNIFIAFEAFSDKGGMGHRFTNILNQLDDMPFTKASTEKLLEVLLKDASLPEKIESLTSVLKEVLPEGESRKQLELELAVIKESTVLSKGYNDQMMMMQLPIKMESHFETVELFLKKKKGQFNPNDLTLLVALNTHHMGEVRCLIHKINKNVNLMFSLEDEDTKLAFESNRQLLSDVLEGHKSLNFNIQFGVNAVEKQDWDIYNKQEGMGFDVKV